MLLAATDKDIRAQLERQLSSLFALNEEEAVTISDVWDGVMQRLEVRFSRIRNKYYSHDGQTYFDPLHGCQWAHFLYTLSNEMYRRGGGAYCVR